MAITNKKPGVWGLDEVYNKQNEGDIWDYDGTGELFSWGPGGNGRLGLNDTVSRSSPTQIPGAWGTGVKIAWTVGYYGQCTMAIKTDGTLWGWGSNQYGALMNNETGNPARRSSPVQIPGTTYADVATSNAATAVIKTDGTFWIAGHDSNGNLGLGHNQGRSSPHQLPGTTWTDVSGGSSSWLARKSDGTLWSWGENGGAALGQGNKTQYSSPRQVGTNTTWSGKISIQSNKSMAIKTDGTLWSWGDGDSGALAQNNQTSYSSPRQVGTDTTWNSISDRRQSLPGAGANFLATKTDGTLWAWGGQGDFGSLGLNQGPGGPGAGSRSSPTQVGTDTNWSLTEDPYVDSFGASAMKTDGTFWVWGGNDDGRLGFNTPSNTRYSSPTQLPGTWSQGIVTYGGSIAVKQG